MASKKLTLNDIKNEIKVYDEKKRVELSDGFHVFIYPHFSPTKIAEYVKETITDKLRAEELGINFDNIEMADWSMFNIIYKFTDLGIPNDIKKKVQAFLMLINSKHFAEIITSFPVESIQKLNEAVTRFNENLQLLNKNVSENDLDNLLEKENLQ